MNIGTHFDYDNHVAFISTHTKMGTLHEKAPDTAQNGSEFVESAVLYVAANFRQCLPMIVTKLSTWDANKNLGKTS